MANAKKTFGFEFERFVNKRCIYVNIPKTKMKPDITHTKVCHNMKKKTKTKKGHTKSWC